MPRQTWWAAGGCRGQCSGLHWACTGPALGLHWACTGPALGLHYTGRSALGGNWAVGALVVYTGAKHLVDVPPPSARKAKDL